MNELVHFDKAAEEFYSAHQIKGLPLTSWDLYSEYFGRILKSSQDAAILDKIAADHRWVTPLTFEQELFQKGHVVVVTDASLKIVHATKNMVEMNGYNPEEVLGKTPKMFQGKETSAETRQYISDAVKDKKPFEAIVLNYRKDGSPYKCWIKAQPIFNNQKKVVHFIAYEKEVA